MSILLQININKNYFFVRSQRFFLYKIKRLDRSRVKSQLSVLMKKLYREEYRRRRKDFFRQKFFCYEYRERVRETLHVFFVLFH